MNSVAYFLLLYTHFTWNRTFNYNKFKYTPKYPYQPHKYIWQIKFFWSFSNKIKRNEHFFYSNDLLKKNSSRRLFAPILQQQHINRTWSLHAHNTKHKIQLRAPSYIKQNSSNRGPISILGITIFVYKKNFSGTCVKNQSHGKCYAMPIVTV